LLSWQYMAKAQEGCRTQKHVPTDKHDQQHTRSTNHAMPQRHQSTSTCYAQSSLQQQRDF